MLPISMLLKPKPSQVIREMKGWNRPFEDPILLPDGRKLIEERGRPHYGAAEGRADARKWQTAISCLIMAAEGRGPLMHARIGVLQALHRNVERVFTERKDHYCGKRKLARDQ
jgi:hypothetical protein